MVRDTGQKDREAEVGAGVDVVQDRVVLRFSQLGNRPGAPCSGRHAIKLFGAKYEHPLTIHTLTSSSTRWKVHPTEDELL